MMTSMNMGLAAPGFRTGFSVISVLVTLIFVVVLVVFVVILIKGIGQWSKNNRSPRLTVPAAVVGKRMKVSHHNDSGSTRYYVTFEVDSGDRMEFTVTGPEYGMLIEGDRGSLSFQGTRYLGFERA